MHEERECNILECKYNFMLYNISKSIKYLHIHRKLQGSQESNLTLIILTEYYCTSLKPIDRRDVWCRGKASAL